MRAPLMALNENERTQLTRQMLNHHLHAHGIFNKDGYYYMQYKMIDAQHRQELIEQIGDVGRPPSMRKI